MITQDEELGPELDAFIDARVDDLVERAMDGDEDAIGEVIATLRQFLADGAEGGLDG
jgi:hypothetical protein